VLGILTVATAEQIRADFDRIATLDDGAGNNEHYHSVLLQQLPSPCGAVLEVGCGLGRLARAVAKRADCVIALDFSPAMIERARHRSRDCTNIEYHLADIREWSARSSSFDCVIAVATLHHLDHTWFCQSAREWLRPGGRLLVHDLLRDEGWSDRWRSALAAGECGAAACPHWPAVDATRSSQSVGRARPLGSLFEFFRGGETLSDGFAGRQSATAFVVAIFRGVDQTRALPGARLGSTNGSRSS
jgi:SAM-dependent methyltransferase